MCYKNIKNHQYIKAIANDSLINVSGGYMRFVILDYNPENKYAYIINSREEAYLNSLGYLSESIDGKDSNFKRFRNTNGNIVPCTQILTALKTGGFKSERY